MANLTSLDFAGHQYNSNAKMSMRSFTGWLVNDYVGTKADSCYAVPVFFSKVFRAFEECGVQHLGLKSAKEISAFAAGSTAPGYSVKLTTIVWKNIQKAYNEVSIETMAGVLKTISELCATVLTSVNIYASALISLKTVESKVSGLNEWKGSLGRYAGICVSISDVVGIAVDAKNLIKFYSAAANTDAAKKLRTEEMSVRFLRCLKVFLVAHEVVQHLGLQFRLFSPATAAVYAAAVKGFDIYTKWRVDVMSFKVGENTTKTAPPSSSSSVVFAGSSN